jgi:hypothetical protein
MRTNTNSCGILTFAILFYLSVGLDERRHIGENYRKLAIPAGLCRGQAALQGGLNFQRCLRISSLVKLAVHGMS